MSVIGWLRIEWPLISLGGVGDDIVTYAEYVLIFNYCLNNVFDVLNTAFYANALIYIPVEKTIY